VPLHSPTAVAPRRRRVGLIVTLAATCATAGAATIVIANDQTAPHINAIAEPSQPVTSRYFDIEANKAASMRALGLHIAQQRASRTSRYQDLEANKARSQRAR
jgi:hypothetical protein